MKKREVNVKVRSVIDGQVTIERSQGQLMQNKSLDVLTYEVEMKDIGPIRHFITIQEGKVNVKRSGQVVMNQQFLAKRITESNYQHPYGQFHIEITTKQIDVNLYDQTTNKGSVDIKYTSIINGSEKQTHRMMIEYEGE